MKTVTTAFVIGGLCFVMAAPAAGLQERTAQPNTAAATRSVSLAKPRATLGMKALAKHANGLIVKATGRYGGHDATFELVFDAQGRFRMVFDGDMSLTRGFDGTTCWERDWMGTSSTLALSTREYTLAQAWLLTGVWTTGERFEASSSGSSQELALQLAGGTLTAAVEFDAKTSLPKRMTWQESGEEQMLKCSDYKSVLGMQFPQRIEFHSAGEVDWFEVDSVEPAPSFLRSPYAPLPAGSADTTFDATIPAEVGVHKVRTGHLLVKASVDGSEPRWFILDSGAGAMTIDKAFAKELGAEEVGKVTAQGIGGSEQARFVRAKSFSLGPMTLAEPIFVELDLSFLSVPFGVDGVAGIVGYGFFSRCSAVIDMELALLELHEPGALELDDGDWIPLVLSGRHPCVKARFEGGREELFKIDTGAARSTVAFHAPAVERLKLLDGRETTGGMAGGVGGMLPVRRGPVEYFELAGHRFENVDVEFATVRKGAFADEYTAGNIGGQLLKPFRLVLDYPNQRIALVKRPLE